MARKYKVKGRLPKKNKEKRISKASDLTRTSERSQLNFAIATSEFQGFLAIFTELGKYVIPGTKLHDELVAREFELEAAARRELQVVFNLVVKPGDLAEAPIADMDEGLRKHLDNLYQSQLRADANNPSLDGALLGRLGIFRKNDPTLFPSISPIHAVMGWMSSDNYEEQFTAYQATKADGYVAKEGDITTDDLVRMHVTLATIACVSKKDYPLLLMRIAEESQLAKPSIDVNLAEMLLSNVVF